MNNDSFLNEHPVLFVIDAAAIAASAYHGYKRNDSIGWALVWGAMGALLPLVTVPVAFAQGFGQPKQIGQ